MGNLLYVVAIFLILLWAIGFFGYHVGGNIIHFLLVLAVISVLLRVIKGDKI